MPATMIHLLTAYKISKTSSPLFFVGTIAPDTVSEWYKKDITHFRNLPDRTESMKALSIATSKGDMFGEGVLLHLFLDWEWDLGPLTTFKEPYSNDDWLPLYRNEIALIGGWLFHNKMWAKQVWEEMIACEISSYGKTIGATNEEVNDYIKRTYNWHKQTDAVASTVFTLEYVELFTDEVINRYIKWREMTLSCS